MLNTYLLTLLDIQLKSKMSKILILFNQDAVICESIVPTHQPAKPKKVEPSVLTGKSSLGETSKKTFSGDLVVHPS